MIHYYETRFKHLSEQGYQMYTVNKERSQSNLEQCITATYR